MSTLTNTFVLGSTIIIELTVRDKDGNLFNPANAVTYTVNDPDGTPVINNQPMSQDGLGQYHGDYTPTGKQGRYAVWVKCVNGSRVTVAYTTALVM